MLNEEEWEEIVTPQSVEEVVGNAAALSDLRRWASAPAETPALVTGPTGAGKSRAARLVLEERGYCVHVLSFSEVRSKKYVVQLMGKLAGAVGVLSAFCGGSAKHAVKNALVVDDVECLPVHMKPLVTTIFQKRGTMPVVFTCNVKYHKLLEGISTKCVRFNFMEVATHEIWEWCENVNVMTGVNMSPALVDDLAVRSGGDMRQAKLWLRQVQNWLYHGYSDKKIKHMIKLAQPKNRDLGLITATAECLNAPSFDIDRALDLYALDRILLPRMVHENIHNGLLGCTGEDATRAAMHAADDMSSMDLMYAKIHGAPHDDELHPVLGTFACWSATRRKMTVPQRTSVAEEACKFPKIMTVRYQNSVNNGYLNGAKGVLPTEGIAYHDTALAFRAMVKKRDYPALATLLCEMKLHPRRVDQLLKILGLSKKRKLRFTSGPQKRLLSLIVEERDKHYVECLL